MKRSSCRPLRVGRPRPIRIKNPCCGRGLLQWAVAGLLALLASSLACASPLSSLPPSVFGTHWYTIIVLGNRSGYSCQTLRQTPEGLEAVERSVLRVQLGTQVLTSAREELRRYDHQLNLQTVKQQADEVGRKVSISATRDGAVLRVEKETPEGRKTETFPLPPDFGQELQVLPAIVNGQMQPGWQQTFSTFDSELGTIDTIHLKAIEPIQEPRTGWLLQADSALLSVVTKTWLGNDGTVLRQEVPGMMGMTLELVAEDQALAEMSPLLLSGDIPVSRDIPSGPQLVSLCLLAKARTGSAQGMFPTTPRQTATLEGTALRLVVQAETAPKRRDKLPVKGAQFAPYLASTDLAESTDPAIVAKTRAIVGKETDAWTAARKLVQWVYCEMTKVDSEPRPMSACEILRTMRGDCTEHAVLLAALAQAAGIPARMVVGLAYDQKAFHYHAWNELYVGRWVEVDATWGEQTVDAGHVQIAAEALDTASLSRLSLASGRTMGALDLDILNYRRAPE